MRIISFLFVVLFHLSAQAQLDVQVITPPFLRQGDRMELKALLKNSTSNEITGQAELQLTDSRSGASVDGWFQNVFPAQYLTIAGDGADTLRFPVEVPYLFYNTLAWKLILRLPASEKTRGATFTREGRFAILTDKIMCSEAALLPPDGVQARLAGLLQSEAAEGIEHRSLTISAATDPALLLYLRLLQQANSNGHTVVDVVNRFFALMVLQSSRFKPAWPVVQGGITAQLQFENNTSQQPNSIGAALLNVAAYQTSDGGFSLLLGGKADLQATVQATRKLLWLSQLQMMPEALKQQVSLVLGKATDWLYRQSITEIANPADAQALPELFYTYSVMSYSDAAKSRLPQLAQRLQYEKVVSAQGKAYHLLGLRNSLSAQHQSLFQQISSDTILPHQQDVPAMLLTYAAAEGLESLKPNLVQEVLQDGGDASWAAYALLRTFAPTGTTITPYTLHLGTGTVQVPDSSSFFTTTFQPPFIRSDMGTMATAAPHAWTLVTWLYHQEQAADEDTLVVKKTWFKKGAGDILEPLSQDAPLKIGDVLTVRIMLNAGASGYGWLVQDSWPAAMTVLPATHNTALHYTPDGITFHTYGLQNPAVLEYNLLVRYGGNFSSGPTVVKDAAGGKEIARLPAQTFYIE